MLNKNPVGNYTGGNYLVSFIPVYDQTPVAGL